MTATGDTDDGASSPDQLPSMDPSGYIDRTQMMKLFECPVCLEVAWPPVKIYQCMQGHIICDTCKAHPQMGNCPICRQLLSQKSMSRNLALENLALAIFLANEEDAASASCPQHGAAATFGAASASATAPKAEDEEDDIIVVELNN